MKRHEPISLIHSPFGTVCYACVVVAEAARSKVSNCALFLEVFRACILPAMPAHRYVIQLTTLLKQGISQQTRFGNNVG